MNTPPTLWLHGSAALPRCRGYTPGAQAPRLLDTELREGIRKALPPGKAAGLLPQSPGWLGAEGKTPPPEGPPCCQQFPLWAERRTSRVLNLEPHFTLPPASEIQSLITTCQQDPRPGQDPESPLSSPQGGRLRGLWQQSLGLNFFL